MTVKTNYIYSVLVAGRLPQMISETVDACGCIDCEKELTLDKVTLAKSFSAWAFVEEFKQYPDVKVKVVNCINLKRVPKSDFVVFIGYNDNWNKIDKKWLKLKTGCIKIVSLLDIPYDDSDWSYTFRLPHSDKTTLFVAPVCKRLYQNIPKKSKSILIDHYWLPWVGTEKDWTAKIQSWLESISNDYTIYRLIRFPEEKKMLRSFEIPIPQMAFPDYLARTDNIETFIITHMESYNYSIIDMVARGIRVFTPPSFLHGSYLADHFRLPEFANQKELLSLVKSPIDARWGKMIDKCTDYSTIAKTMDCDFRRWKREDNSRRIQ